MNQNRDDMDDHMFLLLVFLVIVLVAIPALYAARADIINGALLFLARMQIKAFAPFSGEAHSSWARIAELDPASLTWEQIRGVLRYTGTWIRWPFAVVLGLLGAASIFIGRTWGLLRRFNMERLLRNNAESFACLRPVVGRGNYLLSMESFDSGLWCIARSPVQFALENGLLLDESGKPFSSEQALRNGLASMNRPAYGRARLDEAKTLAALQMQLGPAFTGFEALSPCRKALAAAFIAYAGGDKKESVGILDTVSASYAEKNGKAACPVLEQKGFSGRVATAWERHQAVLSDLLIVRHSASALPWFMALLNRARQKGVLASSQFLWLRPMDRPLWYALNQCGGRAAWAEGFAAWAHYVAEEKAGKALPAPHMARAVASLRDALDGQGWLIDTPRFVSAACIIPQVAPGSGARSASLPARADSFPDGPIEPMPEVGMVYAEAEENPEYDVYEDQSVRQEQF